MDDRPCFARLISVTLAVPLLMSLDAVPAHAQQSRDARVLLTAGGPTAAIRAMAFSADSRQLYLAGADKSVEIWRLPDVLENAPDLHLVNHARWPVARQDRGQIWGLAVNDTKSQLAFGGYGAMQINGDISIADMIQGRQLTILPPVRPNEDPKKPHVTGHLSPIRSLSYSPDGEWLASISLDGDLRLWSVGTWDQKQVLSSGQDSGSDVHVQFISKSQFVASLKPMAGKPQLLLFTIGVDRQVTRQDLESPHESHITSLASDPKLEHWFSGDSGGNIAVWKGNQKLRVKSPFRNIPVRSISASQNGLVMTLYSPAASVVADGKDDGASAYLDLDQFTAVDSMLKLIERREWKLNGETHAAAISRDGTLAAMTRPGEAAVEVYSLVDNRNQRRLKPFSETKPTVLAGTGATVQRLQFAQTPATLLNISTRADGTWTHGFNLATAEVIRPDKTASPDLPEPADWKIRPDKAKEGESQSVEILHRNVVNAKISLDFTKHGHYAAHCWIREKGKASPSAVAIGTSRQNGVFVYDLRQGALGQLLRYYRDHSNTVISLSQSSDGRYLATSSRDQTVRIWSLDGLFEPQGRFSRRAAWGGGLEIRNGQLIVTSLIEPGILASRGMEEGDEIVKVEYFDATLKKSSGELKDPSQMMKALEVLELTESAKFWVRHNEVDRAPFMITPGWEPMVTLFIDRRHEWVAWTSQGYYNSSVNGDELIGFQLNGQKRGDPPEFYPAEQLRQKLERPDLLKGLFASGSFKQAVRSTGNTIERVGELAARIPSLEIISPRPRQTFATGEPVKMLARVTYSADQNPANYSVEASFGGVRLDEPSKKAPIPSQGQQRFEYEWGIPQVPGDHRAVVHVNLSDAAADGNHLYNERTVPFKINGELMIRQLHVLAIGAEDYKGELKIPYCNRDARDFLELLIQKSGPCYEIGVTHWITDDRSEMFEKTAFLRQLDLFRNKVMQSNVRKGDLVVVYISGHGCAVGTESKFEYYFVPPVKQITELTRSLSMVQQNAIPWSAFRNFINQFPCDRLFIIDTCFSGNVTQLESDKAILRPMKNVNTIVFAATALDQLAKPDHDSQHGLFTEYVLKALRGSADGVSAIPSIAGEPVSKPDGKVTLQEMIDYVSQRVEHHYPDQSPRFTPPRQQLRLLNVPLTTTEVAEDGR